MKTKMQPTDEQVNALIMFAAEYGARWKSALRHAWETGNYEGFEPANHLQTVRNTLGPSWLVRFNLKHALRAQSGRHDLYYKTCAKSKRGPVPSYKK